METVEYGPLAYNEYSWVHFLEGKEDWKEGWPALEDFGSVKMNPNEPSSSLRRGSQTLYNILTVLPSQYCCQAVC